MNKNYIDSLSSKEINNIFLRGMISVIIVVILYILFYCFIPIGCYSGDLDTNFNIYYETIRNENVDYIFSLSGLKVKIEDKIIVPKLVYSGNNNSIRTIKVDKKYYVVYPVSWKENSLKKVVDIVKNTGSNRKVVSNKSVSIVDIRNSYQNIPIEKVVFYKTDGGINRLIYNDLDTFKIVTYSYRNEVDKDELYWNKDDGYYYLISPGNAESLFVYSNDYSSIDIV